MTPWWCLIPAFVLGVLVTLFAIGLGSMQEPTSPEEQARLLREQAEERERRQAERRRGVSKS